MACASLRRQLTLTNALTCAFLAYMCFSLVTLYRIAVPSIPSMYSDAGVRKRAVHPLWAAAPGIALELRVSTSASAGGVDASNSATLLTLRDLPYAWNLSDVGELELALELPLAVDAVVTEAGWEEEGEADLDAAGEVRTARVPRIISRTERLLLPSATREELADEVLEGEGSAPATALRYAGVPSPVSSTLRNVTVRWVSPGGLRLRCVGQVTPGCRRLAAAWREAHPSDATGVNGRASAAAVAARVVKNGLLPALARRLSSALSSDENEEEAVEAERGRGGLVVYESSDVGARRIARAIAEGRTVHAHAVVRWQDASQEAGGPTVKTVLSSAQRRVAASAPLCSPVDYQPVAPVRFLWTDFLPVGSEGARSFARLVGVGERNLARSGVMVAVGDEGVRRAASARVGVEGIARPAAPTGKKAAVAARGSVMPHWLGGLSLAFVMQTEEMPKDEVPAAIQPFLRMDETGTGYSPSLTANPVRPLRERFVPLNGSVVGLRDALPLKLRLAAVSAGTWRLMSVMDASLTQQRAMGATERDTDDVIRLLAETPLWLLGLTFIVSFIHLLFDALAFKSDFDFWSSAKSLRGISVKTLFLQAVGQVVISLYLWREGSSLLVMVPQVLGTALLFWKMGRASGLTMSLKYHVLPLIGYDAALASSAQEGEASRHDAEAVGAVTAVIYPLIAVYALYTLVYDQHATWADWALGTAVSAVYGTGFALMTPQLWINYRLRSVAALPWRVLGYRFFNTIIDDLFAAVIRMPLLHRISVFRDDIIFVLYLYQRWIYPVDTSRPVEGFEDDDNTRAQTEPKKEAGGGQ
jgi:hypothetical protein